ncbi:phage Gp37/Gp68 family protein [Chelatococcus daeguensis]|uniref:phage Gp37/Gp68 family protein n=1 Tax=Chelatococcus daeguensis TaxID=444444 RepID=UPI0007AC132F|nr:phage Gp37/Gp68 family protein [Chelatococcus daeguensis]KZE34121.1 hypothetical protein AVW15_17555 [Chelatococcus daeguensis]MBM3081844.1 phage Gp37/Gp68 family protein [Chelatococcus daeguensis]
MGANTKIEWTETTWNPLAGCSVVSPGCTNCYAMQMAHRIKRMTEGRTGNPADTPYFGTTRIMNGKAIWTGEVHLVDGALTAPLRWKRPRRIFVNSMSDLFHEAVPDEWIDRIFAVMALAPQHTFQVLTKRSGRMREYMNGIQSKIPFLGRMPLERIHLEAAAHMEGDGGFMDALKDHGNVYSLYLDVPWPLPNVWLGVSAEDQRRADERVPDLLATPAAVRFVSAEPLLGPIDFTAIDGGLRDGVRLIFDALEGGASDGDEFITGIFGQPDPRLDWIIVGGESGPGARPMHPDWARSIRDQCAAAGVPFFFKQWGEWLDEQVATAMHLAPDAAMFDRFGAPKGPKWHPYEASDRNGGALIRVGKKSAGRLLDGREHNAMPEVR